MFEMNSEYKIIASVLLVGAAIVTKWILIKRFKKMVSTDDLLPRRLINSVKNGINLLIVFVLIVIWMSEIRLFALSLAAFAVALVLATRDLIQCFIGSLYQASARSFSVGDWIKVGHYYGEVVNSDWLSTKLLEIDIDSPSYTHTGRTLNVPNHLFISGVTQNLNFMRRYVQHTFTLVRDADSVNIYDLKEKILEKSRECCAEFHDVAQRYNDLIERRLDSPITGPDPEFRITTTNMGKNECSISIFCPTQKAVEIEQKITEEFMSLWYVDQRSRKGKKRQAEDIPEVTLT